MGSEWAFPRLVRAGWIRILLFWLLYADLFLSEQQWLWLHINASWIRANQEHPYPGCLAILPCSWQLFQSPDTFR
ncbi:hypothetical protein F5146DRAFT_264315 [Armillaria mellea]|nr:hypothetical protein F5146DRAFT_264315 [Armillaria mellea]